ncbi:7788_t:CDS:2, partial [Ambispora leptoticha]
MTEIDKVDITNQQKENNEKQADPNNYNFPEEKSHWEKYKLYYLVGGSFFLTTLIILISNLNTNKQIRKINSYLQLGGNNYSSSSFFSDLDSPSMTSYSRRLETEPFPEYVKKRVKKEIKKIQRGSFGGQTKENREDSENDNLIEVKQTLDKEHFGMKKVKELIIEHLAVKKQAKKKLGTVLCLVGPPGTGKTKIAGLIAQALGRPFERVSLGGVHDEGEIRGHRSTYVSAKPGVIVQACQRAKVKNPVILVDEVDKMNESKYGGNPAAAFLEILDPEQNENFRDHYIELPVDLSQIMFICTANQIDTIPGPLRDRMEIIEIPSYTKDDKQTIAENHLVPRLLKKCNLTNEQITFESSAIQEIIDHYTWEAGLKTENITAEKVREYLGKPEISDLTFEADYSKSGVVNGLSAYNPEIGGGNVLPIE